MQADRKCTRTKLGFPPPSPSCDVGKDCSSRKRPYSSAVDLTSILVAESGKRTRTQRPCLHALDCRVATRDYQCDPRGFDQSLGKKEVEIEGYRHSERYQYHMGHGWVHCEDQAIVRIGLDDFAARLIGCPDAVYIPPPRSRIFPDQPAFALRRGRYWTKVLSPIQGTILAINHTVLRNPKLIWADALQDGWLALVKPNAASNHFDSLLQGKAAKEWLMRECGFLRMLQSSGLGARQSTGKTPKEPNMLISDWAWVTLVETFLHTMVSSKPSIHALTML